VQPEMLQDDLANENISVNWEWTQRDALRQVVLQRWRQREVPQNET
jgi:hypothetical protein